ncbi:MAG: TspO/MBR family protein [Streptosporangiaceae bacterium]
MKLRSAAGLAAFLGASAATAGVGSLGSRRAPEQYGRLVKPRWAPPAEVFGPVWSVLYAAIGLAGWRAWRSGGGAAALALHGVQLALNAAWPAAFFAAGARRRALAVNVALDAAIAAEIAAVWRRDRLAAAVLTPYLAWSLYATALTAAVRGPSRAH